MPFFTRQKVIDKQIQDAATKQALQILNDTHLSSSRFNIDPLTNQRTGQGTDDDITVGTFFKIPDIINIEQQLETAYIASWAIAKLIDIPVDDMFLRPRVIENLDDNELDLINEQYQRFGLTEMIPQFIKSSRVFGSALMSVISADDLLVNPFNLDNVRPGDVKSFIFNSQFLAFPNRFEKSILNRRFAKPAEYKMTINGSVSANFNIHASRVIKLDGKRPLSTAGWIHTVAGNSRQSGISLIVAAAQAIISENSLYSNTDRLVQRSSVVVAVIEGLKDAVAGGGGNMTKKECSTIISSLNKLMADMNSGSISAIDADNSISRLEVGFQGLAALFDQNHKRVAAVADISKTRFYNDSATGFFSTGNGEATDHAKLIASMQIRTLQPIFERIDAILVKNVGINKKIKFNFPSLVDLSEKDIAQANLQVVQALSLADQDGAITADEYREVLNTNGNFGNLDGAAPKPVATPDIAAAANKDISQSLGK